MMENDIIYDIWLQSCFGVNNTRFISALELFGSAEEIYKTGAKEFELCGLFTERELQKLSNKSLDYAEETVRRCDSLDIMPVSYTHPLYPERLRTISGPPVMLYIKGRLPAEDLPFISIFGTRYPTDGSSSVARSFARGFSENGAVVVSGGAIGIDQSAHKGALEVGGKTICVAGCGIDHFPENGKNEIRNELMKKGTIISEYPPGYPATRYTFPMRDRLITGLSDCCVIVQSGTGSGSLIAARYAVKQGRKLFVVPGSAYSERTLGNNLLLKAGFSAALDHEDVLSWYDSTRLISDKEPNPPLTNELDRQLSVKPESINYSKLNSGQADSPGYRMSLALKNNLASLLSPQEKDSIPARSTNDSPAEGKLITRDVSDALMKDYLRREVTPSIPEIKAEPAYFQPVKEAEPESVCEEKIVDISAFEQQDKNEEGAAGKLLDDIRCSMDFASKEYKEFVMDDVKYRKLGKESPYVTLDREFLECLFLPKKEAFEKISELIGDPGLKLGDGSQWNKTTAKNKPAKESKKEEPSDAPKKPAIRASNKKNKNDLSPIKSSETPKTPPETIKTEKNKEILSERLTEDAVSVYDTFSDTSLSTDEIILAAGLPAGRVFVAITELCSAGYIRSVPGSKYIKTK